jgi:tRNA nucleotidyltransferase (CCA-adding enzyme)
LSARKPAGFLRPTPLAFYAAKKRLKLGLWERTMNMKLSGFVGALVAHLRAAGARALVVGGAVADFVLGREPKDIDLEVYGVTFQKLEELLTSYDPKAVGRAFGVLKVRDSESGTEIDVSVPRADNHVGIGHKDVDVELLDPSLPFEEAVRLASARRDATFNALAYDPESGNVLDFHGGLDDLYNGVFRATDPELFVQDTLRWLRAMQLTARKARTVDPATLELMRGMPGVNTLPAERVFEEWKKLLMCASRPSVGLEILRACGKIAEFPALAALIGCPQNPEWHPEGDVWNHTLLVLDEAARVRDRIPEEWRLAFVFGALLHDVGKPSITTEDLKAIGHDEAGVPVAEAFMQSMTADKDLVEKVLAVVGCHMSPGNNHRGNAGDSAWRRLHNRLRLDVAGWISRCDYCGSFLPGTYRADDMSLVHPPSALAWAQFEKLGVEKVAPTLLGRHLVERGMKPGPAFKAILQRAYEAQLENAELTVDQLYELATK